MRFQKQQSFQLVLISLKTPQGTFELKFLGRRIQNADLVNLLLAFEKERKEYSILPCSHPVTSVLSGETGSREEAEVEDCRKAICGTKWKRGSAQCREMGKAVRMTVSLCDQKRGKDAEEAGGRGGRLSTESFGPSPGVMTLRVMKKPGDVCCLQMPGVLSSTAVSHTFRVRQGELTEL